MSNNILQPISPDFNTYSRENAEVHFNATVPAAPASNTNVTWQFDQFGNVSAYVPTSGGGGGSVGSAGQVQKVGATAGSFAASSITDNGTTVAISEPTSVSATSGVAVTVTNAATSHPVLVGQFSNTTYNMISLNGVTSAIGSDIAIIGGSGTIGDMFLDTTTGGSFNFRNGSGLGTYNTVATISPAGLFTTNSLALASATTATSATAGAATALPATPLGYLQISVNGTNVKIPYYTV